MFTIEMLRSKSVTEVASILKKFGIKVPRNSTDTDKIFAILDFQASNPAVAKDFYNETEGVIETKTEKPVTKKPTARRTKKPTEEVAVTEAKTEASEQKAETPVEETATEPVEKPKRGRRKKVVTTEAEPTEPQLETSTEAPQETKEEVLPKQTETPKATPQNTPQKKQRQPNQNRNNNHPGNGNQNGNQNGQAKNNNSQNQNQQNQNQQNQEVAEPKKEFNFDGLVTIEGVLEILPDNYGFLRSPDFSYISSPDDVYVSTAQIRNFGLKTGDTVKGIVRLPKEGEKYFSLQRPVEVNGRDLDFIKDRVAFEHLTPLFPQEKFNLAGKGSTVSTRVVDLFAPIGKGQRAMIVAQPKTGKTMLLKDIANAISSNHPEAYMMVLLIDERPEEVTDMERSVNAEVIASTFDEAAEKHVKVANLVLAKAQRMVECGHDVVILLDSITRLARAYNTVTPASGKILSGGVDANALHRPKRFFGSARKIENGGSLTIIATALIDTGSKMDEVIFEEFKGTGNMELQLDRKIANKRIYPAIDLVASSTRRDDLLHDELTQQRMWIMRKYLSDMNAVEAMEFVDKSIKNSRSNEEFLMSMNR
ncbi:MAG: transcription termination factor Rho [Cruoricaptor ignavus]|nr:transcription termination factor Rho [Cruoricaptor ignavus]